MHHQHDKAVNSQALASCIVHDAKFSDGQSIDDYVEDSRLWQDDDDYDVDDDDDYGVDDDDDYDDDNDDKASDYEMTCVKMVMI